MRCILLLVSFWALVCGTAVVAQTYPAYQSTTVNDYADLLTPNQETTLVDTLNDLKIETGVEMTVLTLRSQAAFAPGFSLEQFATGVFDTWGIGSADLNDGVLVMVLQTDRAMRIELGAGYGRDWDRTTARVVDRIFLPSFREDKYGEGIMMGTDAVIEQIVLPFKAGADAPTQTHVPGKALAVLGALIALMIAAITAVVIYAKRLIHRLRKCPQCGEGGLNKQRIVTASASKHMAGRGINRFHCDFCEFHKDTPFVISRIRNSSSSSSRGSFGGGRSGGGGASGRW